MSPKTKKLYRIMTPAQYKEVRSSGFFMPPEFEREGHVYACYLYQAEFVAGLLYNGEFGLTLLEIDPARLDCEVEDKNLKGGTELFPHIKGPIPASACVSEYPLPVEGDGSFELPIQLQEEYRQQRRDYGVGKA
jgi:uncharacterized protein (DUF952 family)